MSRADRLRGGRAECTLPLQNVHDLMEIVAFVIVKLLRKETKS